MGQTLTHGVYLPDEGERNCYNGLATNWQLLDNSVGTIAEHTSALAGKAPLAHTHTKSDITDLLNSNFIPSSDVNYTLGSSDLKWKQIWAGGYKAKLANIDFTDSTTTGSRQSWWVDTLEKNGTSFFGVGSIRTHSLGLNEEHFRIKNAEGKWADLYIQLGDNNQFTIGTAAHSDVTNNGFRGKFTPLDSFIPNANNSYDLGSSSYQWNNLYAKNYYYNGVAWGLNKSNVWTADQTIAASKFLRVYGYRFQIKNDSMVLGTVPSSNQWTGMQFVDKNETPISEIIQSFQSNGNSLYQINVWTNEANSEKRSIIAWGYNSTNSVNNVSFSSNLTPQNSNTYNLGTTTNRWKTINGVNPGALGLPSGNYEPLNTKDWDLTGATGQSYTPTVNGWLFISIQNIAGNYLSIVAGRGAISIDGTGAQNGLRAMLPVIANESVGITVKTGVIFAARFYPMQGNVS